MCHGCLPMSNMRLSEVSLTRGNWHASWQFMVLLACKEVRVANGDGRGAAAARHHQCAQAAYCCRSCHYRAKLPFSRLINTFPFLISYDEKKPWSICELVNINAKPNHFRLENFELYICKCSPLLLEPDPLAIFSRAWFLPPMIMSCTNISFLLYSIIWMLGRKQFESTSIWLFTSEGFRLAASFFRARFP